MGKAAAQCGILQHNPGYSRPELFPEVPVKLAGFKLNIDTLTWLMTSVVHHINDNDYTTITYLGVLTSNG